MTSGHIVGSNNLWKFSDSLQVDRRNYIGDELNDGATTADEKAPFLLTIEERCEAKLAERKIKIPEELLKYQKQDVEDPKKEEAEV